MKYSISYKKISNLKQFHFTKKTENATLYMSQTS